MVAVLFTVLLFSSQAPAYIIDFLPTYAIAKGWPVFTLPFSVLCLIRRRVPGTALLLLLLLYSVGVTPIIGMMIFPVGYVGQIQSAAKMLAFLNVFSTFEILLMLRPRAAEVHRALLALAGFTIFMMWLLWETVPLAVYQSHTSNSLLFFWDLERGARIYAPMVFVFYIMFVITRSQWQGMPRWRVLGLLVGFVTMAIIYKQKLATAAVLASMGASGVFSTKRHRLLLIGLGLAGAATLLFVLAGRDLSNVGTALGGSLETRVMSAFYAIQFMKESAWRLLLGVSSLPQHGDINLAQIFRFHMFFVSDLGWLGIVFEYGMIGTLLVIGVYAQSTLQIWRSTRDGDPWRLALFDYAVYLWCVQTVYSAVVAPGELMTYLAVALYLGLPFMPADRRAALLQEAV